MELETVIAFVLCVVLIGLVLRNFKLSEELVKEKRRGTLEARVRKEMSESLRYRNSKIEKIERKNGNLTTKNGNLKIEANQMIRMITDLEFDQRVNHFIIERKDKEIKSLKAKVQKRDKNGKFSK